MKKNLCALIVFMMCFLGANAQDSSSVENRDTDSPKTESKFHVGGELHLMFGANVFQTYNGLQSDILPAAVCGANIDYGKVSIFGHGLGCFTSLPMPEQKYRMLIGESCFGVSFKEGNNTNTTVKVGKILIPGKYGLAAHKDKFVSTDVLYDMFKINSDRALNRGCTITQNFDKFNVAVGYTEQDGKSGLKFNGNNPNIVVSGGYNGAKVSAQFVYSYSLETKGKELNCYFICNPNENNMVICKVLGVASDNQAYEISYSHNFKKLKMGVVTIVGSDGFVDADVSLGLPHNIFLSAGIVNNDPCSTEKGLNPKIGLGFHAPLLNVKTR